MTDTIGDILIDSSDFFDLYDASGITVGSTVIVQNKANVNVLLVTASAKPAIGFRKGVVLRPYDYVRVSAGESGLWALCSEGTGVLVVQDATLT